MATSFHQIKRLMNGVAGKFGYVVARVDTIEEHHARLHSLEHELERASAETRAVGKEVEETKAAISEGEAARKCAELRAQQAEESIQRHAAAAAEVERVTLKLQECEATLQGSQATLEQSQAKAQESEARNATLVAEVATLTSALHASEARHAAATVDVQRLTNELVESKASQMAALAEIQRLTSVHVAEVERLTGELHGCQTQCAAATSEAQSLTELLKSEAYARVSQEQYATIFRRKTEELTLELSQREAEMAAGIAAEKAEAERLTREAARLTAENARLVCDHADMAARMAEHEESDRLARTASRLATKSSKISVRPHRLTFHPFKAHEDSMRPVLEQRVVDMDAPTPDPSIQQKIELGRSLSEAIDLYRARKELSDAASVIAAQSLSDRLSPHQFKRLLKQQQDTLHLDQRKKHYRESESSKIYQGISYEVIRKLILSDPTITSSLNIGCNYAYMDWLLAKQFDNVVFRAVDVNPDLVEINSDLKLPNTEFYSGYALELIESGQLKADVVYTSSAATVIRNLELRTYLKLIAQWAKYFLISEPIWALPGGEIIDPKAVHPLDSVPAYVQREPLTGDFGYLCWIHNYRSIIESAGFDVVEYRFCKPDIGPHHWCVVLGQNKDASRWRSEGAA